MAEILQQKVTVTELAKKHRESVYPEEFDASIKQLFRNCRKHPDPVRCREYTEAGIALFFSEPNFEVKKIREMCDASDPYYKDCLAVVRNAYETLWLSTQRETIEKIAKAMGII